MTPAIQHAVDFSRDSLHGVRGRMDRLSEPVRIVLIVHAAQGLIDNGGFQYFFEADFPGTPPYAFFVDAYRTIGAEEEARIFARAVALFNFPEPHLNRKQRNKYLDRWQKDPRSPMNLLTDLMCGNKAVWEYLETYIQQNKGEFSQPG
jgi:hypothetical protein